MKSPLGWQRRGEIDVPIYGSVDIRDAGWKIAVVDANQFPAGFNNTSESDFPQLTERIATHIERHQPGCQWVHIYPNHILGIKDMLRTYVPCIVGRTSRLSMYNRESRVGWIRCFEWNTWSTLTQSS